MKTCPFSTCRDIFGVPGTGVHAWKFKGTSLIDYFLTIVFAFITTALSGWPLVFTTIGTLVIGIVLHILFGVNTEAVQLLGLTCYGK